MPIVFANSDAIIEIGFGDVAHSVVEGRDLEGNGKAINPGSKRVQFRFWLEDVEAFRHTRGI